MINSEIPETNMQNVPKEELRKLLQQKAKDLFILCDKEGKGFTTKMDMHRLQEEVPLTPDQLDEVFDVLDKDRNGYLTLEEFTEGFGMFLGIETQSSSKAPTPEITEHLNKPPVFSKDSAKEEEEFEDFLDELGAHNVFKDEDYIQLMWQQVKNEDPVMLRNFEDFLGKITRELKNTKKEYSTLESTLKNRSNEHEQQVSLLYAEMEEQLKAEKERLLEQERSKEKKIRDELEAELQQKDQLLQELLKQHEQLEEQLEELNNEDSETRHENAKLQKERDVLENKLVASEKTLNDMKAHLQLLRKKSIEEKRKRAKAVFKASEGIALEREDLVKELNQLKKVNKQLLDEKDELFLSASNTPLNGSNEDIPTSSTAENLSVLKEEAVKEQCKNTNLFKDGHQVLCKTMATTDPLSSPTDFLSQSPITAEWTDDNNQDSPFLPTSSTPLLAAKSFQLEKDCEVDDNFFENNPQFIGVPNKELTILQNNLNFSPKRNVLKKQKGSAESKEKLSTELTGKPSSSDSLNQRNKKCDNKINSVPKVQQMYQSNLKNNEKKANVKKSTEGSDPERLFKIVFIGDSGVGKSSFIHRFCNDSFRSTFCATIGVDFQVKTINIDGHFVALQLWDTAGQERFRSLTKQYFRKADGIIIVYDVTSETSYKNVRNWIYQVKDGSDENVVIMLIGNKIDLCDGDEHRVVKTKDGCRLADEFGTLFFETSAKTGNSVSESIMALSSVLQEKEDEIIEKVVQLQEAEKKKKKCC